MVSGDGIELRFATIADVEDLAGVQLRSALAGFSHIFPETVPKPTQIELEEEWRGLISDDGRVVIAATVAGSTVGGVIFGENRDRRYRTDAHLLKLYVDPEHVGQGVGGSLHDRAIEELASAGHKNVRLWVLERNLVARRMYERRGWTLQPWAHSLWPGTGILEIGYSREISYSSAI